MKKLLVLLAVGLLPWATAAAAVNDYPTIERVEYVLRCARDLNGPVQENLYKCSCALDAIARRFSYAQFVEYSTDVNAFSIGGERGEVMRGYTDGKKFAGIFRSVQADARKACFIR